MTPSLHAKTPKGLTSGSRENLCTNRKTSKQKNGKSGKRYAGYFIRASFCES